MRPTIALALVLALTSAILVNAAYLREHDAAAALPRFSPRHPIAAAHALLADRVWLAAFAMETAGFGLYVAALALAPLALVQSVGAGGIGLLAVGSARLARRRLSRRESLGTVVSVLGLLLLALSLSHGSAHDARGSAVVIVVWLAAAAVAALVVLAAAARRLLAQGAACGVAGGLLFAVGDISTKAATQGGVRIAFAATLIAGYALGTSLLQIGYQRGAALSVAGIATLLTNAVPIAAGTVVLHEGIPGGALGVLRVLAFAAVVAGAILLARGDGNAGTTEGAT
ncbi:MAG TPA: DMT family transporter [Solirubrobacteraceae bacterium]